MSSLPAVIGTLVPIFIFSIPIVAILTKHQQKMAEIFRSNAAQLPNAEIQQLRQEVQELKSLVYQQTLALDSYASRTLEQRTKV